MGYLIDHTPERRTGLYDIPKKSEDHGMEIARINANIDAILSGKMNFPEAPQCHRGWKPRAGCIDWDKTTLATDCLTMTVKELSEKYHVPENTIRSALRAHDLVAKKGYHTGRRGNK